MTLKCWKVFTELVKNNVHVNICSVECTVYLRHWKGWVYCTVNKSLIAAQSIIDTGPMCFDHTTFYWRNTCVIYAQEFRFVIIWGSISPGPQAKTGDGNLKNYVHKWADFTTNSVTCLISFPPLCTVMKWNSRPKTLHVPCLKWEEMERKCVDLE
jgi:hypothetical protein